MLVFCRGENGAPDRIRTCGLSFGLQRPIQLSYGCALSVEDSPNSTGVAIDLIRFAKLAKNRGLGGSVHPAATCFCKHPPRQLLDDRAFAKLETFIRS